MRKEPGVYQIELYDELGHKFNTVSGKNLQLSEKIADDWEKRKDGYSAVVMRVVYNTRMKRAKFQGLIKIGYDVLTKEIEDQEE